MSETDFSVWVGCLACYNEGRLTGAWVSASECDTYVPCERACHEEWWVMDHECPAIQGECSPAEAHATYLALEYLTEATGYNVEVIYAYAEWVGQSVVDITPDSLSDSYCGDWGSWREYTDTQADELLLATADEAVARYFDYRAWADDLEMDHYHTRSHDGRTLIFQEV